MYTSSNLVIYTERTQIFVSWCLSLSADFGGREEIEGAARDQRAPDYLHHLVWCLSWSSKSS